MAMNYELRVLVVDDSEDLRLLLKLVLHGLGCTVCGEAANGVEAIAEAQRCSPDLIVLDIAMPVMDGLSCLPIMHASCPEAVIVMFSAQMNIESCRVAALANGAAAFVNKERMAADLIPIIGTVSKDINAAHRTANDPAAHVTVPALG